MKHPRLVRWATVMLVLAAISLPAKSASAAENVDILQMLQTAKTPADHEAIAKYYDAQAAEAKRNAELHRKMASSYTGGSTPIGKGAKASLPQHCLALAKDFDTEAAHYAAMAEMQRELAKSGK
jgi:hypothetical protein